VSLFKEARARAAGIAGRALERAPANVRDTVERIRRRYDEGRIDAQKAMEELASIEERALRVALQLALFPWATAGAIRELYGRLKELEGGIERRDETIRRLEERIRQLEQRGS
jgi:DNA repair exonuclease SbcCD ATPase subunit